MSGAPTYPLATVTTLAKSGAARLTNTDENTAALELGMDRAAVFAAVASLTASDFYKTMESTTKSGLFQDVYRPVVKCPSHPGGVEVYCKVQLVNGVLVFNVISFKRK